MKHFFLWVSLLVLPSLVLSQDIELEDDQMIIRKIAVKGDFVTILAAWGLGVNGPIGDSKDYSLGVSQNFGYRRLLTMDEASGSIGIGLDILENEADGKLQIKSLSAGAVEQPALQVGNFNDAENGYLTVNQTEGDVNSNIARFRNNGSSVARINKASHIYQLDVFGTANADTYTNNSDRRYKRDIKIMEPITSKLTKLKPVEYNLKRIQAHCSEHFGFIAQELITVFPHLVFEDPQTEYLSVNYIGLIPVLVKANQEIQVKMEQMEVKNRRKRDSIHHLLKRIEILESME